MQLPLDRKEVWDLKWAEVSVKQMDYVFKS